MVFDGNSIGPFYGIYRPVARVRNARHSPNFYLRFAFADVLFNRRLEYEQLKLKNEKPAAWRVAVVHCRDESYASASIKQTAHTAMRLPWSVTKLIRNIANKEDPLLC